ncbi:polyamine-modulated factor 1-binding protein 1-like [Dendronephthya gigantea]|uniref:polyamine-modulated factor 1-binding protein 1-like n=1 Tax=Dendronephthya gigantea TaxID=151771 RepID=UPI00106C4E8E|nr:polyamine-modulated factor 1-binding protein 1-like [Dendronephthya gigantea]
MNQMAGNEDTRSVASSKYGRSPKSGLNGSLTMASGRYPQSETASFSTSMGRFDTCILGREIIEPQKRHTLYKIEVDGGFKKWVIYRRYRDFVLLNKKLKKLFPNFLLTLPPKRVFGDNFNKDFVQRRQEGLNDFVRNILNHHEISQSAPVVRFFRFENPPQPHESLDASQNYCEDLEQTIVELRHNCRELEDEIQSLKNELDHSVHYQREAQGLASHYEMQFSYQGSELQDLNLKVNMAQQAENQAKTELEELKVEIQTERAHVRAARDIEKHKQAESLETKWSEFRCGTEDVNTHLDSLLKSFSQLSNVHVTFADKSFEFKPSETMVGNTEDLKKAIDKTRQQQESIYKNMVEMYNKEVHELKAELARQDFITQTRTQEAETLKGEMKEIQSKHANDIMEKEKIIYDQKRQLAESQSSYINMEQKYFYALLLGVKLNMVICGFSMSEINFMKPQNLYNRAKASGLDIDNWPGWVSRELASISSAVSSSGIY